MNKSREGVRNLIFSVYRVVGAYVEDTWSQMRESKVEAAGRVAASKLGGVEYKWVSPGNAGVPDRIKLLPVPPEHQALVARYVRFVEYKAPKDGELSEGQKYQHKRLRRLGYTVEVVDEVA